VEKLLWLSLATSTCSMLLSVACAVVCSRLAFRATRALKRKPPSESILAKLATDQAEVFSSLESLATTVKRISSRHAMQARRSNQVANEPPPLGASKAELRRYYGLKAEGPEFAKRQLAIVPPKENEA